MENQKHLNISGKKVNKSAVLQKKYGNTIPINLFVHLATNEDSGVGYIQI